MGLTLELKNVTVAGLCSDFSVTVQIGEITLLRIFREADALILFRLVTGLQSPDSGEVLLNGDNPATGSINQRYELCRRIGTVPPHGGLVSNLKLWENITLPLLFHSGNISQEHEQIIAAQMEHFGYCGNSMALPAHLTLEEKRMAALVRALLGNPELLILGCCLDGVSAQFRSRFAQSVMEYHQLLPARTTVILETSTDNLHDFTINQIYTVN